jgi:RNA polymerase sigma-70 factor (ECF subfamily)
MDEFRDLYERHYSAVYTLALFLTGDSNRAEDLTADTFVRAWTARDRLRVQTVPAYLLTIARNLHRDQYRRHKARFVELDDATPDARPGVEFVAEQASNVRALRKGFARIAPGDRRALLLYSIRDMSYAEIASALGISVAAVKSRISRARDVLRARMPAVDRKGSP